MKVKDVQILGIFFGVAFILRFFSLFPAVINHDESTYIVISNALLDGGLYFVDVIDTKPIGVFLIYAALQKMVGGSIFLLRTMVVLWLAPTAFVLYRAKRAFGSNRRAGIATGIIYLLLNSIFVYYGISPNTETFFNLFTALGLLLMIKGGPVWRYFLSGLVLGLGFLVKYVAAFDALAFGLFLLWDHRQSARQFASGLGRGVVMAIGSCIPMAGLVWYYFYLGHLDEFLFYTFESSRRYPVSVPMSTHIAFVLDFFLRFLPISVLFFSVFLLASGPGSQRLKVLGGLWSLLVLTVILLPGKWYGHYFIQLMLPVSFVAGTIFEIPKTLLPGFLTKLIQPKVGLPILLALVGFSLLMQKKDCFDKPDHARAIARYLQDQLQPEDRIYTSVSHQILYHLLDKESPTKYVHPSLFWEQKHLHALEIDLSEEMAKITDDPPRYIIWREDRKDDRFDDFLANRYQLVKTFGKEMVYERR